MNRPCPQGASSPPGRSLAAAWRECCGVRKGEGDEDKLILDTQS